MDFYKRGFPLLKPHRLILSLALLPASILVIFLMVADPAMAQAAHTFPFRATNYDVEVVLHPESQTITALAKVDFVATEVGKTLLVELHPDLQVSSVKNREWAAIDVRTRWRIPAAVERQPSGFGDAGQASDADVRIRRSGIERG